VLEKTVRELGGTPCNDSKTPPRPNNKSPATEALANPSPNCTNSKKPSPNLPAAPPKTMQKTAILAS
jgi:hypothetical protein